MPTDAIEMAQAAWAAQDSTPQDGWQGWKRRAVGLISGRLRKRSASTRVGMQETAFRPTAAIALLATGHVAMLYLSVRYQLNFGYVVTFLGIALMLTSAWISYAHLLGLTASVKPNVAGACVDEVITFSVQIENPTSRRRAHVCIHVGSRVYDACIEAFDRITIEVPSVGSRRGILYCPDVVITTPFPFGLWSASHRWQPAQIAVVYPRLERDAPSVELAPDANDESANPSSQRSSSSDGIDGLKAFERGESTRHIAWRVFAKTDGVVLASRQREAERTGDLWLTDRLASAGGVEETLSRLAAWVKAAETAQDVYGLQAFGQVIEPGRGIQHYERCMTALGLVQTAQSRVER